MYYLVSDTNYDEFVTEIEAKMLDGWKCQGGVCVFISDGFRNYYQAMTK
jgi:hypothetical protein